jgi:POT family proton-dependent oligopeptide transporter
MAATTTVKAAFGTNDTFMGHPKGLFVLFFTEMWERFSYYGMRALLVLYMTQYLLADPERAQAILGFAQFQAFLQWTSIDVLNMQGVASKIYGYYTGFVYLTPLLGGYLADRFWGQNRSVYIGGTLMMIGHFLMASEQLFLPALFFLILGNGAFKPNISSQVGRLYADGDSRIDGAYTLFYMGINLGAFLSPIVCGTLGQKVGWHYGFGAAGVGMFLGLLVYHFGQKHLPKDQIQLAEERMQKTHKVEKTEPLTSQEIGAIVGLAILCVVTVLFWAIYEQQGNTLQLWADEKIDWVFFGWTMPSSWFQSLNPLIIFCFAPLMDMFWRFQTKNGRVSTSIQKMGWGSFLLGGGFLFMVYGAMTMPADTRGNFLYALIPVFLFTIGELYVSPIGLALVSKLAPKRLIGTLMGVWLLSSFFGNVLSGEIGVYYSKMSLPTFFGVLAGMGIFAGVAFYLMNGVLSKSMGLPDKKDKGRRGGNAKLSPAT